MSVSYYSTSLITYAMMKCKLLLSIFPLRTTATMKNIFIAVTMPTLSCLQCFLKKLNTNFQLEYTPSCQCD